MRVDKPAFVGVQSAWMTCDQYLPTTEATTARLSACGHGHLLVKGGTDPFLVHVHVGGERG